jgi:hypothetical protein
MSRQLFFFFGVGLSSVTPSPVATPAGFAKLEHAFQKNFPTPELPTLTSTRAATDRRRAFAALTSKKFLKAIRVGRPPYFFFFSSLRIDETLDISRSRCRRHATATLSCGRGDLYSRAKRSRAAASEAALRAAAERHFLCVLCARATTHSIRRTAVAPRARRISRASV